MGILERYQSTLLAWEEKYDTSKEDAIYSKVDSVPTEASDNLVPPREPGVPAFKYDKLKQNYFRCFKLVLNDEGDPLCGRLMTAFHKENVMDWSKNANKDLFLDDAETFAIRKALTGTVKYDALSYSWDSSDQQGWLYLSTVSDHYKSGKPEKQILMDHEEARNGWISIMPSLQSYLEEMRRRKYRRFIWIDAICINQHDIDEKSMQIPMMRDIYEYAAFTKIWLGTGTAEERNALGRLNTIAENMQQSVDNGTVPTPHDSESFSQANIPLPSDPIWRSIGEVMKRPYWSRLWTLQEGVVHNPSRRALAEVLCGDQTLPISVFQRFMNACDSRELKAWILTGQTTTMPPSLYGFDALAEIRLCAESYQWGVTVDYLLPVILRREATISADKVFGLLALVDHYTARQVAADITSTAESIYLKFARYYILSGARESLLNHVTTRVRREGLPSWCPNFASPPQTFTLGTRWFGRVKVSQEHKQQMFRAGFHLKGKWEIPKRSVPGLRRTANVFSGRNVNTGLYEIPHPQKMAMVPDTDWLLTYGVHLDTISGVVDLYTDDDAYNYLAPSSVQHALAWDSQCLQMAKKYLHEDSEGFDMYARTLAANRVRLDLPARSFAEHWDTGKALLYDTNNERDFVTPYFTFKKYLTAMKDASDADLTLEPPPFDESTKHYVQTLVRICRNRRFFATKGGRIGVGPANTEVGDKVVVLFFCATPYVIRESTSSIRNHLVGECYVHGYMYGKALEMLERGEVGQNSWILE